LSGRETLVLGRHDVAALLTLDDCIAAVEGAFRLHAEGHSLRPAVASVASEDGAFHVKAAGLRSGSRSYFAAKVNGNFPGNPERARLPAIQGLIVLSDASDGRPLAVMDSIEITILRTGAATAVAAKFLARRNASVATVWGCGRQGRVQLQSLARVRPVTRAYAFDADRAKARAYAREMGDVLSIPVEAVSDPVPALRSSDLVVTCTPSRDPFLRAHHITPGTFVAAVGADSQDKQELDPRLLASSTVVVDVLEACAEIGELHHALASGLLRREDVHGELADVVSGRKPGRSREDETIVFDSTGTALEDVAAAALVYEKALASGRGLALDLGA
jgi:alanine dehydrogenase